MAAAPARQGFPRTRSVIGPDDRPRRPDEDRPMFQSAVPQPPLSSPGPREELEQERLRARERRLHIVLGELRERARESRRLDGRVSPGLGQAIAAYEREVRTVHARLDHRA
jgi:hypothetical protein